MKKVNLHDWIVYGVVAALALAIGGGAWWGYTRTTELSEQVSALTSTLASTTSLLIATIEETKLSLSSTLQQEKENLEDQLGDISGTVQTLEKLSKTDPELLQKYSKVFFLNEHYAPERLATIDAEFLYSEIRPEKISAPVSPHLEDLLEDAKDDAIPLYIKSAYRSFDEQEALKGQYTVVYGAGSANQFSADQGYSEHQLGTAVDFITTGTGGALAGFEQTAAYQWLLKNAHTYGFILSYPKDNGYYIFEPWHWRYVGVRLAKDLNTDGEYFYDLDQRKIDEYLVSLFD